MKYGLSVRITHNRLIGNLYNLGPHKMPSGMGALSNGRTRARKQDCNGIRNHLKPFYNAKIINTTHPEVVSTEKFC